MTAFRKSQIWVFHQLLCRPLALLPLTRSLFTHENHSRPEAVRLREKGKIKKKFNGLNLRDFENLSYYNKFILADGTSLAMQGYDGETANGEILIDINGQKRPNKIGEDTFLFSITNSRLVPYNFDSIKTGKILNKSPNGYYFSGWVLTYENMDYLHCSDL